MLVGGLHVVSLLVGLLLVAECCWGPTSDRHLGWIGFAVTLVIFVAGIAFLGVGWVAEGSGYSP